jgi:hypothetical protein
MALYLSSDLGGGSGTGSSGGSGDITTLIRSSTSWYFHGLRRDDEGMLYYTTLRPTDVGTIDVFNEENSQLSDLLDGVDNVEARAPILELSLIAGGTREMGWYLETPNDSVYTINNLLGNKRGYGLNLQITRSGATGTITEINILDGGRDFALNEEIIVPSTYINESDAGSNLYLKVTKLVKTYTNSISDKYQQYRFDLRKISYYIDDEGYLVAKFGNHDYTEPTQSPR